MRRLNWEACQSACFLFAVFGLSLSLRTAQPVPTLVFLGGSLGTKWTVFCLSLFGSGGSPGLDELFRQIDLGRWQEETSQNSGSFGTTSLGRGAVQRQTSTRTRLQNSHRLSRNESDPFLICASGVPAWFCAVATGKLRTQSTQASSIPLYVVNLKRQPRCRGIFYNLASFQSFVRVLPSDFTASLSVFIWLEWSGKVMQSLRKET